MMRMMMVISSNDNDDFTLFNADKYFNKLKSPECILCFSMTLESTEFNAAGFKMLIFSPYNMYVCVSKQEDEKKMFIKVRMIKFINGTAHTHAHSHSRRDNILFLNALPSFHDHTFT